MKFGKLADISPVDFSLAPTDGQSLALLAKTDPAQPFRAFVGCPMWGNKGWIGKIYPPGAKAPDFLHLYSHSFQTIELNTTHYRVPDAAGIKKWKEAAVSGFTFCPKVPQRISHYSKLQNCQEQVTLFCDRIALFEEKLGCCFLQLHESFSPAQLPVLARFLEEFPQGIPLAVEFRHADWFFQRQLLTEVRQVLESHQVCPLITDVAGRRDVSHGTLCNGTAMIRFVGNGLHPTDFSRADRWVEQITDWVEKGLKALYFFVHEPDDTFAPEMGKYVIAGLNRALNLDLPIPGIPDLPGNQMQLF